ncbi:fibronectin type III domain-containing protein [Candidatus Parcubacteria bacterium]|nr:fibronectin type III domain-containing protein [Candidatus Parcubacteria bacterium]
MMNKISKTILISERDEETRFYRTKRGMVLIILLAVFGLGLLSIPFTQAQVVDELVVEFEETPLFSEANFLPGESITRWVRVTNNSTETKRIATEAINVSDPNNLGAVLNLEIKEGTQTLYNNDLSLFFNEGEVYLSDLGPSNTTTYDFSVSFYSEAGNPFQDKSLVFDILVGFQGEEDGILPGTGGGGGGWLPPGLTILDESVHTTTTGTCEVIINWTTSYFSTSQVIYASEGESHTLDLSDNTGTPPKYGYAYTTQEYHTSPKVTGHTVTISDLTPLTTYYFRAVSHASPATISRQFTFTTTSCSELYPEEEEEISGEISPFEEGVEEEEVVIGPEESGVPPAEEEKPEAPEEIVLGSEEKEESLEEEPFGLLSSLLASIGDAFGEFAKKCYSCLPWWLILIFILYPLYKLVIAKEETKINQKEKIALMSLMSLLVILALYCYFTNYICVQVWVFLILALITILLRHFFFGEITGFKNNLNLILGLLIILIFFIVLLIMGCLPLWLILLLLVIYFFVPDFFRCREKKTTTI